MFLTCVGLSHHTAALAVRERVAYPELEIRDYCQQLAALPSLREGMLISTCNRTELYAVCDDNHRVGAELRGFLERTRGLGAEFLSPHLYDYRGPEAVRHLFRVASSLDSMVVGEPQILGQVKSAYAAAKEAGAAGAILSRCLDKAVLTAKRIRTETGVARNAVSVSSVAVELARKVLGSLDGRRALLVGAGEMAELTAQHLHQGGTRHIVVANRSPERAKEIARRFDGTGHSLERLESLLVQIDVAVTSTAAADFVIRRDMMKRVIRARRQRSIVMVDIAVPRDIDPRCNGIDNVYVYDLDDLQNVVQANLASRLSEATSAERIVREQADRFQQWLQQQAVIPTIRALREKYMTMARAEAKRTCAALGGLDPKVERKLFQLTETVAHKILHHPTLALKRSDPDESMEAAKMLFALGADEGTTGDEPDSEGDSPASGDTGSVAAGATRK